MLRSGVRQHLSRLQHSAATPIVYRRIETGETASLDVTIGETFREQNSDRGLTNIVRTMDIVMPLWSFEGMFGAGIRPKDNDEVEFDGVKHKVLPLGGETCWRVRESVLRIHLKEVGKTE